MKTPFRLLSLCAALASATIISQLSEAQYQGSLDRSNTRYLNCLRGISINADQAFQEANRWRRQGGGPPAEHCEALALIEVAAYDAAAPILSKLAVNETTGDEKIRASLYGQAGNTWIMAGNVDNALADFDAGIAMLPKGHWLTAEFLIDKGRALMTAGRWPEAEIEFSRALEQLPEHMEAIVLRANTRRELDDPVGAIADLESALAIDPESADALVERGFLRKKMHDLKGAKRDFERVLEITSDGHAAALALNGLAKLAAHEID